MSRDIKALIRNAKRAETTEDVCLRGDLASKHELLVKQIDDLPASNSLSGHPDRRRLLDEAEAVRQEMAAATVTFTIRGLPEPDFQTLWDAHPPRREGDDLNPGDARWGFNRATFLTALIPACVVDPELDDEDWKLLFAEALTSGTKERLGLAALRVNRKSVDVPFSLADSEPNPD